MTSAVTVLVSFAGSAAGAFVGVRCGAWLETRRVHRLTTMNAKKLAQWMREHNETLAAQKAIQARNDGSSERPEPGPATPPVVPSAADIAVAAIAETYWKRINAEPLRLPVAELPPCPKCSGLGCILCDGVSGPVRSGK